MSSLDPQSYMVPIAAEIIAEPQRHGHKGAGLLIMRRLGLPVPPGFILTTDLSRQISTSDGHDADSRNRFFALWRELWPEIRKAGAALLEGFSDPLAKNRPLLLAVRSSPIVSMPGMMDTLFDVRLEDEPLRDAIWAVIQSANAQRARDYRALYRLPAELPSAVVIQAMVYGNRRRSAAGVYFTRDPSTGVATGVAAGLATGPANGAKTPYGEFLLCAQGAEVVSGTQLPRPLNELRDALPEAYAALLESGQQLERHLGDMQDIEFTIEEGKLWLLQTRSGKRSGRAMVRIAVDLCREGVLTEQEALERIEPARLSELLYSTINSAAVRTVMARGLPASPGVATGQVVFSSAEVEAHARRGEPTILCRIDTSPEDIVGIKLAAGVLTARGGMTSHAAVLARGLGRIAVVGASALQINYAKQTLSTREYTVASGDILSIDGNTGEVLLGEVERSVTHLASDSYLGDLRRFAKALRRVAVYAFCKSADEATLASELSADGLLSCEPGSIRLRLSIMDQADVFGRDIRDTEALAAIFSEPENTSAEPDTFLLLSLSQGDKLAALCTKLRAWRPQLRLGLALSGPAQDELGLYKSASALGLDFIACPPLRLPIAETIAAQANE